MRSKIAFCSEKRADEEFGQHGIFEEGGNWLERFGGTSRDADIVAAAGAISVIKLDATGAVGWHRAYRSVSDVRVVD
ncbi:MAG: hypothetical protein V3T05_05915 [Myxococcota bacterium]